MRQVSLPSCCLLESRLPATYSPSGSSHHTEGIKHLSSEGSWHLSPFVSLISQPLSIPVTVAFKPHPPTHLRASAPAVPSVPTPTSSRGSLFVTLQLSAKMLVASSPDLQPQDSYPIFLLDFSCGTCPLLSFSLTPMGFPSEGRNLVVYCCVPSTSPVPGMPPVLSEPLPERRRPNPAQAIASNPLRCNGPISLWLPQGRDHVSLPILFFLTE